jgi:hypothetical protein
MGTKPADSTKPADDANDADLTGATTGAAPVDPTAGATDLSGTNSNVSAPVVNKAPTVTTMPVANTDPAKGSIDTSGKAADLTTGAPEEGRCKIGKTYKFVNLKSGPDLVNPHAIAPQPREFPFNTPVEAEMDGFLQSQYLARRLRVE